MLKRFFLFIKGIVMTASLLAQIPQPPANLPSPNAWSFTQYGNVPVTAFTGQPEISLPLFNLEAKDYKQPVTLSYNASGFRPDIHPSWVGSNWNLNVGGVITRNVKGLMDEYNFMLRV